MEISVRGSVLVMCVVAAATAAAHPRWVVGEVTSETHACDGDHETKRSQLANEAGCGRPRDHFVELTVNNSYTVVNPSAVWVKRCQGVCKDSNSCVATSKRQRQVPVRYVDMRLRQETCAVLLVEEHLHCGCHCALSDAQCKHGQRLNHRKCKCECKNLEEKRKCLRQRLNGKLVNVWNQKKCVCEKRQEPR